MTRIREYTATPAGRFLVRFGVILSAVFLLIALRPVNDHVVNPYTTFVARQASLALNLLGETTRVSGQTLASPRFSVVIYNGCNGLEAMLIFVCGVLAFPASWPARAKGIALGYLVIAVVNLVRVVSLYYVGILRPDWFQPMHVFVWQTAIVLLSVVLWLLWVRRYGLAKRA